MATEKLKNSLKNLHNVLSSTEQVDAELSDLLVTLQEDIGTLLKKQRTEEDNLSHLGERAIDLSAKFAVKHPRLEMSLRELGELLASMGI